MSTPGVDQAVLIGGTGRSGTTIAGRMLNHHPELCLSRSREVRFLTSRGGLIAALGSRVPSTLTPIDPTVFAGNLRGRFFRWRKPSGAHEGLYRTVDPAIIETAVEAYLARVDIDPLTASRELICSIVPHTLKHADRRWVDTTPTNVRMARALDALLPQARIVHMMRDGRDVAVSFTAKDFGPDDPLEAVDLWGRRMLSASAEESALDPSVVTRIDLLDWVGPDAVEHLRHLCDVLGVAHDPGFEQWCTQNVTADGMHAGRWRSELDARTAHALDERYAYWCEQLTTTYPQFALPRSS